MEACFFYNNFNVFTKRFIEMKSSSKQNIQKAQNIERQKNNLLK